MAKLKGELLWVQHSLIGGFLAHLHIGPTFETIFPKYFVSLEDPYIYDLLKVYIPPPRFQMDTCSHIIQLKAFVCIRFGNDIMSAIQPYVHQSERLLSMVKSHKSKNLTPITFDSQGITYPKE